MRELALKHREYINRCHSLRTASDGMLNEQLRQAYAREQGTVVGHCGSCFINQVIPAYIRKLKEIDSE